MKTLTKQLYITLIPISLFSFVGCTQVPAKDTTTQKTEKIESSGNPEQNQSEQGTNPYTKSNTIGRCVSELEENKTEALMDTITSIIHVYFYCLCSDYLTDVKVKLTNNEHTYERITDKLGCDFRHIESGKYLLEVEYESAKKFEPIEIIVMGGGISRWKIFLCEE